jgi:hypothetical protein
VSHGVGVRDAVRVRSGLLEPHGRVVQQLVDDLRGDRLDRAPLVRFQSLEASARPRELARSASRIPSAPYNTTAVAAWPLGNEYECGRAITEPRSGRARS